MHDNSLLVQVNTTSPATGHVSREQPRRPGMIILISASLYLLSLLLLYRHQL
jgi:hypothetical protein